MWGARKISKISNELKKNRQLSYHARLTVVQWILWCVLSVIKNASAYRIKNFPPFPRRQMFIFFFRLSELKKLISSIMQNKLLCTIITFFGCSGIVSHVKHASYTRNNTFSTACNPAVISFVIISNINTPAPYNTGSWWLNELWLKIHILSCSSDACIWQTIQAGIEYFFYCMYFLLCLFLILYFDWFCWGNFHLSHKSSRTTNILFELTSGIRMEL